MNLIQNSIPMLALWLAQIDGAESKLTVYGPMGVICLWLMYRDEKRAKDSQVREDALRLDFGKMLGSIEKVMHEFRGLNRNLLYMTASHSPSATMREVAQRELDRKMAEEKPG